MTAVGGRSQAVNARLACRKRFVVFGHSRTARAKKKNREKMPPRWSREDDRRPTTSLAVSVWPSAPGNSPRIAPKIRRRSKRRPSTRSAARVRRRVPFSESPFVRLVSVLFSRGNDRETSPPTSAVAAAARGADALNSANPGNSEWPTIHCRRVFGDGAPKVINCCKSCSRAPDELYSRNISAKCNAAASRAHNSRSRESDVITGGLNERCSPRVLSPISLGFCSSLGFYYSYYYYWKR